MGGNIKVGDLAYIAKYPCCNAGLGEICRVDKIFYPDFQRRCAHCKAGMPHELFGGGIFGGIYGTVPASWLKRIDPPAIEHTLETSGKETVCR